MYRADREEENEEPELVAYCPHCVAREFGSGDDLRCDFSGQPLADQGWVLTSRNPYVNRRYRFASLTELLIALLTRATIFGDETDDRLRIVAARKLLHSQSLVCVNCGAVPEGRLDRWRRVYRELEEGQVEVIAYCPECAAREFDEWRMLR